MRTEIRGNPMTIAAEAWQALADWQPQKLTDLVVADPDARLQALVRRVADIRFDFAKTHLDARAVAILSDLAAAQDFAGRRKTLFSGGLANPTEGRSEEHTSELQSLMRISYAVFCLKKKNLIDYNKYITKSTS